MKKVMIASFEESAIQNSKSIDKSPKSTSTSGKAAHDGFVMIKITMVFPQRHQIRYFSSRSNPNI